ncbi:hypothetical protein SISSUDRAFT_1053158 [Sistotremastrum suecicum HHB10207 ss-3]|uniref:Gag1-like clamp domain-containing protein n=1 Tax=Sistotremastrum suecicum HHB10207 ss-3 TaxID=1314776 RepID=A0A165ZDB9_9AGAM|nr:hypothetical protein SISSUDRAFT_1053158 [Sistotremastrum suecicum HHB10207 ss-3]
MSLILSQTILGMPSPPSHDQNHSNFYTSPSYNLLNPHSLFPPTSTSVLFISQPNSFDEMPHSKPENKLPPPGPDHYEARRLRWVTPKSSKSPNQKSREDPSQNSSRTRIVELLDAPDAIYNEDTWNSGLKSIWKGLSAGSKLRKRLPLSLVLKIVQAGWVRDGTWPVGQVAPSSSSSTSEDRESNNPERTPPTKKTPRNREKSHNKRDSNGNVEAWMLNPDHPNNSPGPVTPADEPSSWPVDVERPDDFDDLEDGGGGEGSSQVLDGGPGTSGVGDEDGTTREGTIDDVEE